MPTVILQLICPDRPGLVSQLSGWISNNNGNIRHADHHNDAGAGLFLSRLEWDLQGFNLSRESIQKEVQQLAVSLGGKAELHYSDELPRVAIFVSKQSHCLLDLLWRATSKELRMHVPLIISNHTELEKSCQQYNIDYKFIPVNIENKMRSEEIILETLIDYKIDLVVLAKYMQILSKNFLRSFPNVIKQ